MYVCICNAIKEADLRSAAVASLGCAAEVYKCLGKEPQCAQCLEDAEDLIAEVRASMFAPA